MDFAIPTVWWVGILRYPLAVLCIANSVEAEIEPRTIETTALSVPACYGTNWIDVEGLVQCPFCPLKLLRKTINEIYCTVFENLTFFLTLIQILKKITQKLPIVSPDFFQNSRNKSTRQFCVEARQKSVTFRVSATG